MELQELVEYLLCALQLGLLGVVKEDDVIDNPWKII